MDWQPIVLALIAGITAGGSVGVLGTAWFNRTKTAADATATLSDAALRQGAAMEVRLDAALARVGLLEDRNSKLLDEVVILKLKVAEWEGKVIVLQQQLLKQHDQIEALMAEVTREVDANGDLHRQLHALRGGTGA